MKKLLAKAFVVSISILLLPFILTLLLSQSKRADTLKSMNFSIYYEVNGSKQELSFDEYLMGVVAANMPAGYEIEALKAQAVIARTYACYNIALLTEDNPGKNSFATSELGLGYLSLETLKELWGTEDYSSYFSRLENAVYATEGKVLVYNNDVILPVFFDTGSGFTRNASEAWGIEVPYLVSVPSKQDVTSTNYLSIKEYQPDDLIRILTKYYSNLELTTDNFFQKVKITSRDSAGYVLEIALDSLTVPGEEFTKVLGLSSNHFYIEDYEGIVRIICNGSGHGVGLSQYGANAMAEKGTAYNEILEYYYHGISFASLTNSK